jgi:septum formation protein
MEGLNIPFDVIAPDGVEETMEGDPRTVVKRNASAKASRVAGGLSEGLVVGADTIVVVDDIIMGKVKDPLEARVMLGAIEGRMHFVLTGLAVVNAETGRSDVSVVETKVWIRPLTGEEIGEYVSTGEPIGKAGGYAIQGAGGALVERIEGSFENVVGLPLSRLRSMLDGFGLEAPS